MNGKAANTEDYVSWKGILVAYRKTKVQLISRFFKIVDIFQLKSEKRCTPTDLSGKMVDER